jgi:hypothetical protein
MQFNPENLLVSFRNALRAQLTLPSVAVPLDGLGGQDFYVDALMVDLTTSLKIAMPDPMNQRGVPTFDNQNRSIGVSRSYEHGQQSV